MPRMSPKLFNFLKKHNTKIYFTYLLLLYLGLNIIFPWLASKIVPIDRYEQGIFSITELNPVKTTIIYFIAVLGAISTIWLIPLKEHQVEIKFNEKKLLLFYIALFIIALCRIISPYLRSQLTQLDIFLHFTNWRVYFDVLFIWGKKEVPLFILFIMLIVTIAIKGSRAGLLYVFMILFSILILNPNQKRRIQYVFATLILLGVGLPWLFSFSTHIKNMNINQINATSTNVTSNSIKNLNEISKKSKDALEASSLRNLVVRISNLERGSLPIFFKDHPEDERVKDKLELFYKLNHPIRQLKLFLNCFIIGSFFEEDVPPNQYNLHIFTGRDINEVQQRYVSWSMGLPSYLYIYFGQIGAILIFIIFVAIFYILTLRARKYSQLTYITCIFYFFYILDFFDITFHLMGLLFTSTSLFFINIKVLSLNGREWDLISILKSGRRVINKFLSKEQIQN